MQVPKDSIMVKNAVIESQDSDIVDIRQLGIGTDSQKIRKSAKTWKHENTVSYRFGNGFVYLPTRFDSLR